MSAPKGPVFIRLETGDLFNPGTNQYQTQVWEYVRLEDGTDKLVGPAGLSNVIQSVEARLAAGDVGPLNTGTAP